MRQPFSRRVTLVEWIALGASIALWIASTVLPEGTAVVPEYIAYHNALLLIAALIAFTILFRHMWTWLRWWSIPIDGALLGLALLPLGIKAEELIAQLGSALAMWRNDDRTLRIAADENRRTLKLCP